MPLSADKQPEKKTNDETYLLSEKQNRNKNRKKHFPQKEWVSKKKARNPDTWKRRSAALAREKGLDYISQKGKHISGKHPNFGELCNQNCRYKCSEKFDNEQRQKIFSSFYKLDINAKNALLFNSVTLKDVQRIKKGAKKRRSSTYEYYITCDRQSARVCKLAFGSLYQIGRKKIDYLQKRLANGSAAPPPDMRGHHSNRPHKIPNEVCNYVIDHIKSFPSDESHYSRHKNPNKRYLSPLLSVKKMHSLYIERCEEVNKSDTFKVKLCTYRRIFETKFNLSFGHPRSDTCSVCDAGNGNEVHIQRYHQAFELQRSDRQKAEKSNQVAYLTVDLQQTMPLPRLTTSKAFYLRQMWFYNLGIHMITSNKNQANFFTWTEDIANRGSTEVASSLLTLIEFDAALREKDQIIIWSDSCAGQNKNFIMVCLYQLLIVKGYFKIIEHKFPEVGHSFLDSDRDFGRIEKVLRKHSTIYLPGQYREIINKASKNNHVTDMEPHFRVFSDLPKQLQVVNRKINTLNEKVQFRDAVKWIKVERFGYYLYKDSYEEEAPFKEVCILKRQLEADPTVRLPRAGKLGQLSKEKIKNLMEQLPFVKEQYRYFYENVIEKEDNVMPVMPQQENRKKKKK